MNEPLPTANPTKCRRSLSQVLCLQKRRSALAFLIRSLVFLSVVSVFFLKFLLLTNADQTEYSSIVGPSPNYGRRILSLSNASEFQDDTASILANSSTDSVPPPIAANCNAPAINEFPPDGFTRQQRRHGWILVHVSIALYCFWLLAAICDDYFVPAIEQICATLEMQQDVVGATFMAAATSSPELFMNCVGTFVTKGDIGVGTIVGSAVFNVLAVPACCGLFVKQFVRLDWWPVTRDCLMYCVAVLALIATLSDGKIMWYEALGLVFGYFFYMAAMYYNDQMARSARKLISKYRRKSRVRPFREVNEITPLLLSTKSHINLPQSLALTRSIDDDVEKCQQQQREQQEQQQQKQQGQHNQPQFNRSVESVSSNESDYADDPWQRQGRGIYEFLLRWPITFLLWLTIPDSRRRPRLRYITFLLAVAWIGAISYLVAFVITIVGDTLDIPDSVMGLTILAAGMSVPEAVSSIIVTKQGHGAMGISNSLGSNTFDILLCLGFPWFIKAYFLPAHPDELWVTLNSTGFTYSAVFLLTTLFGLYIAFMANRFVLDWKVGVACFVMYVSFMVIASMIELNVFIDVNLPVCIH